MRLPFYVRASILLIGIYILLEMLYIGQEIIVPIIYSTLFAILLSPIVGFFTKRKINRGLSIFITLVLAFSLVSALFIFLSSQGTRFSSALPVLVDKFYSLINEEVTGISTRFNISTESINEYLSKTKAEVLSHLSQMIGDTLTTLGSTLVMMLLIPLYIFMVLLYRPLILEFIYKLSGKENNLKVNEMLTSTKTLIQSYLAGLLIEAAIVAILYSSGLYIIGIEYAILLGIIGALLNVIPYLGGLIALALYIIVAFTTKDSSTYIFGVIILFVAVHVIDNSYIIPKVVASKVKINALVAITAVLAGGAFWGVPGMFISIPLTGVIKLIFDRIEGLKPWGYLLGDAMPVRKIERKKNDKA